MNIISNRSPYYIRTDATTYEYFVYTITIYDGVEDLSQPQNTVIDEIIIKADVIGYDNYTVNLSELLYGYLDNDDLDNPDNVFLRFAFKVDKYEDINSEVIDATDTEFGFFSRGYYYYNENNDVLNNELLQESVTINRPYDISVPVLFNKLLVKSVDSYYKNNFSDNLYTNLNQPNDALALPNEILGTATTSFLTYEERVADDNGAFENSICVREFTELDEAFYDEIRVTNYNDEVVSIKVDSVSDCPYGYSELEFLNKYGVLQKFYFFNKRKESTNFKREQFNRSSILENAAIDSNVAQFSTINNNSTTSIELNTGYVKESNNEVLKQILNSSYLRLDGLPVLASQSSLSYKKRINDGLIDYTMQFVYAFNDIKNNY